MPTPWIERQAAFIDHAVRAMGRRRTHQIGLWLVYTLLVFLLASVMLFAHALRHEARLLLQDAPELVVQRLEGGRHALISETHLQILHGIRGVGTITPRLWGYYYDPVSRANYTLMTPPANPPPPGQMTIGAGVSRVSGLTSGDLFSMPGSDGIKRTLVVRDLLSAASELVSSDLILMNAADLRPLLGIPAGWYTDVALTVAQPREVNKVAEKVMQRMPDARPIQRQELLRTYHALFDWREGILLTLLGVVLLAFAILVWDKASGLSADERREIGILKAIGWQTGEVLAMKLWEGTLVSMSAFLIGYVTAYVHVFVTPAPLIGAVLKGWAVLYPEFVLTPRVEGLQVLTLFFFTVFPFIAALVIPAWKAAITDPDAVMR
ncbi:MAG: FtsX-like permease family protein [Magnetococcales bacterium]|nr:FtsX-like permease family protein [Magnetococcales bacterium]